MTRQQISDMVNNAAIEAVAIGDSYTCIELDNGDTIEVIDMDNEPYVMVDTNNRTECVNLEAYLTKMLPDTSYILCERMRALENDAIEEDYLRKELARQFYCLAH